ncbi:MAG: DUF2141 domain-containing protein [Desulfocapsaceae bacterium]|nr:DUF2141 domain-containing protein [Desulfocapsaceae bacterium]
MLYLHLISQITIFVVLTIILVSISGGLYANEIHGMKVYAQGLRTSEGNVVFCLWRTDDEDFPICASGTAYRTIISRASMPEATFRSLPPGNYAISVMHDEKSKEDPEENIVNKPSIISLPNFGMGVSNYLDVSTANRPDFAKAQINIPNVKSIGVKINYIF